MNKTIKELKEEIVKILTKAGVPGVGYVVDWNKVADMIIGLFESAIASAKEDERIRVLQIIDSLATADGFVYTKRLEKVTSLKYQESLERGLKKMLSTLSKNLKRRSHDTKE